ncbi:MAG: propanediol/glycerol family dehydratase large subunit, partial [Actinomycetales bacterium]
MQVVTGDPHPQHVQQALCLDLEARFVQGRNHVEHGDLRVHDDPRRTSRTHPIFIGGTDFICSGFGSIQRYDNMFGPSQWNAEDIDDYLAMQRDWGVDGGLRTAAEPEVAALRERAVAAVRAVYDSLGLADFD